MGYKVHSIDGKTGEVELDHLQRRTVSYTATGTLAAATFVVHKVPFESVVKSVRGYRVAGSGAVINAQKNATDLATDKSLTSADTWMEATLSATAADLNLAAGDTLKVEIVSVAGSPTQVVIEIEYELETPAQAAATD